MRIAFLGLGRMGRALAAHIARSPEHELTVWNRTPGKAGDLVAAGAREATSVADAVTGAELVLLMLFGPDAVSAVLDEVVAAAAADTLVVDCSTVGPAFARECAERLAEAGLRYVDAPVAGSVGPATEGKLGVLVGGADDAVAFARPVLALWADPDRLTHLGPAGSGSAMKLVINTTLGTSMAGLGEALRLAADLGLSEGVTFDVLCAGPFGWTINLKRDPLSRGDTATPQFALDALAKDLGLALDQGDRPLPSIQAAADAARAAIDDGRGGHDYAALAAYLMAADAVEAQRSS